MTAVRKVVLAGALAVLLAATGPGLTPPSHADDDLPLHHVKYTITAASPIYADIYYVDHNPPIFADYSHNPYEFTPNVKTDVAPGKPWGFDAMLTKPDDYAMVVVSTGTEPGTPQFHCELAVDGKVVVSNNGPRGVLCSLRNW